MTYILNIYIKDRRTKSGKRIVGSYEYDRKNMESMHREVKALYPTYRAEDGYTFEIVIPNEK
jgi:hypothetical protein